MTETTHQVYSFSLVLSGFSEPSAIIEDALFEAGCDDATLLFWGRTPVLDFDREAPSFEEAVITAIENVDASDVGAIVLRVEPDDLVNAADIARRAGVTREAVRLWIEGRRGPGDFPPPLALLAKSMVWSWREVAAWLEQRRLVDGRFTQTARFIAAINAFLKEQRMASIRPDLDRLIRRLGSSATIARLRELA